MVMKSPGRAHALATVAGMILGISNERIARGDVGSLVEIRMAAGTVQAVSGQAFQGVFEIRVGRPGTLGDLRIEGEGWTIVSVERAGATGDVTIGTLRIPFVAIPTDADKPIGLSVSYNGRRVSHRFQIGPRCFTDHSNVGSSLRLPNTTGRPAPGVTAGTEDCSCPSGMIRGYGRIVYTRPDGEVVGADRLNVGVRDNDPFDEFDLLWSGHTDENGNFDTGCRDGNVDGDGSGPDYILVYDTSNGWVDVSNASFLQSTYIVVTDELVEDYIPTCYDFGTSMPAEEAMHTAIHISNVITRARRYLEELGGLAPGEVQVLWPVSSPTRYDPAHDPPEIVLNGDREWEEWDEFTVIRQYGYHFMNSNNALPFLDYCNGWCDDQSPGWCGHCNWCPEDRDVAFSEGFSNWIADVITRSFPERYEFAPGVPYDPFIRFAVDTESPGTCGGVHANATDAAGFIGLLLRDIEDETQDDHDDDPDPDVVEHDGIFDLMCAGPLPIFQAYTQYAPTTVLEFLDAYIARWGYENGDLWATAYNVGGDAYVAGFLPDTQPPGVVQEMDSSTHPLGVGGELPCLSFEFFPASDDVTGSNSYSYLATREPPGSMPGGGSDPARPTDDCGIRGIIPLFDIGLWYVNIRARDNAGRWSNDFQTFGPFEILDCNGTGQLDVCDIDCGTTGIIGTCNYPVSPCLNLGGNCVETSLDCNGNLRPDECDISAGHSEDCNRDGIPDDCQTAIIKHYEGNIGEEWELLGNWHERAVPVDGDHVCIPPGIPSGVVSFSEDFRRVTTLNSQSDFRIDGSSAELRIDEPSFVAGGLTLLAGSTLRVVDSMEVAGELTWQGHEIHGPGTINVFGGFDLSMPALRPKLRNGAHLSILEGEVNIHGDNYVELYDASSFSIGLHVRYQYDGSFTIFAGGPTTIVNVHGSLIRNSGTSTASVNSFVLNSGLIHNRSGDLTLSYGSTQSGWILGDPGTTLRLNNGANTSHALLPTSRLVGATVSFGGGTSTVRGSVDITDALVNNGGICTFTSEAQVSDYGRSLVVSEGSMRLESPSVSPRSGFDWVRIGQQTSGNKDAQFNTGQTIHINRLDLVKGNIDGDDPIAINESFVWGTGGGSILSGGTITSAGQMTIQGASSARYMNRVIQNDGYATFHGGFGMSTPGSFHNRTTGTLDVRAVGPVFSLAPTALFENDGRLIKTVGSGTSSIATHLQNAGTIDLQIGTLELQGGYGLTHVQTAGRTILDGGSLSVQSPAVYQIQGGDLTGIGTVTGAVANSGGNVKPGLSAGLLSIVGNYTQTVGGAMEIELGGVAPGIDFDRLSVSGVATLGGTLRIGLIGGYTPAVGQQFVIVTHGSRSGTFAAVTTLTPGLDVTVIYGPTNVTVEIVSVVTPSDCDANGQVTLDDFEIFPACMGGPDTPYVGLECACLDANRDGGIDLHDLFLFQSGFSD